MKQKYVRTCLVVIAATALLYLGYSYFFASKAQPRSFYRIARETSLPASVFGNKDRNFEAFSFDVLMAIARQQKLVLEVVTASSDTMVNDLQSGNYDAVISLIPPTPANERFFVFSDPLILLGPVLIVPKDSKATSLADMSGEVVGIKTGSSLIFNYISEVAYNNTPPPLYTSFDNMSEALDQLSRHQIDGVLMDAIPAYNAIDGTYKGILRIASLPLTWEGVRILSLLSNKSGNALIEHINEGLRQMQADGTYDTLIDKWGLIDPTRKFK